MPLVCTSKEATHKQCQQLWSNGSQHILEVYDNMTTPDGIIIKSATEVDFAKLKLYTEDVIGVKFDRPGLLEKWITLPTHTALVAVNDNGDVVGFANIRETINLKEDGYRLGPLLADNGDIA